MVDGASAGEVATSAVRDEDMANDAPATASEEATSVVSDEDLQTTLRVLRALVTAVPTVWPTCAQSPIHQTSRALVPRAIDSEVPMPRGAPVRSRDSQLTGVDLLQAVVGRVAPEPPFEGRTRRFRFVGRPRENVAPQTDTRRVACRARAPRLNPLT